MTKKYAVEGLDGYPNELAHKLDDALEINAALVEALKAAPPLPMKSNIDFWYGVYDAWRNKALALAEATKTG